MANMQDMMYSMEGFDTNVDIVFVIDATGSMSATIEMVKDSALSFHENLIDQLNKAGRIVKNIRIKVIWFRDFYYDGKDAYGESKFFELPEEKEAFRSFVEAIKAQGGGDEPETALEALTLAMRSDFVQEGDKKRHIIVLFTDAGAHPLEDYDNIVAEAATHNCKPVMYPENMPKDLAEFKNAWMGNSECQGMLGDKGGTAKLDVHSSRLVLFAPNAYPWTELEAELPRFVRTSILPEKGGEDLEMNEVYGSIIFSM